MINPCRSDEQKIWSVLQTTTMLNLLLFLNGILYDVNGPDDDGSCKNLLTRQDCLRRASLVDYTVR